MVWIEELVELRDGKVVDKLRETNVTTLDVEFGWASDELDEAEKALLDWLAGLLEEDLALEAVVTV